MTRTNRILSFLLIAGLTASVAGAQVIQEQLRRIESEKPKDPLYNQWTAQEEGQKTLQWGGWNSYSALFFEDIDHDRTAPDAIERILIVDNRLWGKVEFENGTSFYGRLRYLDFRFDLGAGVNQPRLTNERLDLDLAYYDFTAGDDYEIRMGRQFIRQGRGLTLNGNFDGVHVARTSGNWDFAGYLVKNTPNDPDIDPIRNQADDPARGAIVDHARRFFRSLQASYLDQEGRRHFAYYLGERDESPLPGADPNPLQQYDYEADYFALGSAGDFTQNVSYYGEAIVQKGSQIALGSTGQRVDIDAFAGLGELVYHPKWFGHPTFSGEYAVGSGDSARLPGLTTISGGSTLGKDGNFLGFGRYDGGIALNPRLSNLNVVRLGTTWRPWETCKSLENLTMGAKYSRYQKNDPSGGISDPLAANVNDDIGDGLDLFLGWRPLSDLAVVAQWGKFSPGDAYAVGTRDDTTNFFLNVTYSY